MIRDASEADYATIARIQQQCPEAAQWPMGDYSGVSVLIADHGFCCWRQVVMWHNAAEGASGTAVVSMFG